METLLASVFLSLSTNLDNFTIGVVYSLRKRAIALPANLLIACLSGASTLMAMSLGSWLGYLFTPGLSRALGSGILIVIGLLSLRRTTPAQGLAMEDESDNHWLNEANGSSCISLKEALILGLALTITNFGTGVGAGISQLDAVLTSSLSFLSSLLTVGCGSYLGNLMIYSFPGGRLEFIAGVLLISLGVYEYSF